jgi:nucleotide-binding universal stress UspA family protein
VADFIVVGVSVRSGSPAALRWAADEARRRRCGLVAVRAWRAPRPPAAPAGRPPGVSRDVDAAFADGEEKLAADVAAALGADAKVECRLVKGTPVSVLLKESEGAVLLVLDAPRRTDLKANTLLAHRLMYHVGCPVVVMPPALTLPEPGPAARLGKQVGTRLAKAAASAGRPGIRIPRQSD